MDGSESPIDTVYEVYDLLSKPHLQVSNSSANRSIDESDSFYSVFPPQDNPFKVASFVCGIFIIAVAWLGSTANFFTAYVFSRPAVSSSISILLAGLAIVDALLLTTAGPIFAANALFTYWQGFALLNFVSYSTVYLYPLASIFQTASVWILTLITVERFIAVLRPFAARTRCSSRRTWLALAAVLTSSVAYNAVRFGDYSVYEIEFTDSNEFGGQENYSISIAWPTLRNNEEYVRIYVHWLYFAFVFALPFSALLIFNALVAHAIRQARRERLTLSRRQSKEHATAAMMIVVVLIFLLCNSLAFVLNALEVFGISGNDVDVSTANSLPSPAAALKPRHSHLFYFLVDANNLSIMLHCSVNFFIYYHFNQRFRIYVAAQLQCFRRYCAWCQRCDRDEGQRIENDEVVEMEEIGLRVNRLERNPSSRTLISYLRRVSSRDYLYSTRNPSPRKTSTATNPGVSNRRLSVASALINDRKLSTGDPKYRQAVGFKQSRSLRS